MGYRITFLAIQTDLHSQIGRDFSAFHDWLSRDIAEAPPYYCQELSDFFTVCQGQWPDRQALCD